MLFQHLFDLFSAVYCSRIDLEVVPLNFADTLAGLAWFAWQRSVLGTIVAGMAVYLPLHIGLGW